MFKAAIESLRPRQWTKNFLVFGALFFVPGALLIPSLFGRAVLAFLLFSFAAGAGYLINDIKDIGYDRSHPRKRNRPIASGRLGIGVAMMWVVILVVIVLVAGYWLDITEVTLPPAATHLDGVAYPFLWTAGGYLILTFVYSMWLRRVPMLDVLVISVGFTLRAVAGAVALKVIISPWLLICTGLLALYLALGKRRQELVRLNNNVANGEKPDPSSIRPALAGYSVTLLDQLLIISASLILMSYSLYTFLHSEASDPRLMLTIPFVIYGVFRYHSLLLNESFGEAPDEVLLADRPLAMCILLWAIAVTVLLLWPGSVHLPAV